MVESQSRVNSFWLMHSIMHSIPRHQDTVVIQTDMVPTRLAGRMSPLKETSYNCDERQALSFNMVEGIPDGFLFSIFISWGGGPQTLFPSKTSYQRPREPFPAKLLFPAFHRSDLWIPSQVEQVSLSLQWAICVSAWKKSDFLGPSWPRNDPLRLPTQTPSGEFG